MIAPQDESGLDCSIVTWRTAACNVIQTLCGQEIHFCWSSHWDVWCYCSISKPTLTNMLVTKSISSFCWVLSQITFPSLPQLCDWILANRLWTEAMHVTLEMRWVRSGYTFSPLFVFLLRAVKPRRGRNPKFRRIWILEILLGGQLPAIQKCLRQLHVSRNKFLSCSIHCNFWCCLQEQLAFP